MYVSYFVCFAQWAHVAALARQDYSRQVLRTAECVGNDLEWWYFQEGAIEYGAVSSRQRSEDEILRTILVMNSPLVATFYFFLHVVIRLSLRSHENMIRKQLLLMRMRKLTCNGWQKWAIGEFYFRDHYRNLSFFFFFILSRRGSTIVGVIGVEGCRRQ